jgi:hypothetical protein
MFEFVGTLCVEVCACCVVAGRTVCTRCTLVPPRRARERVCVVLCSVEREKESAYVYVCVGGGCVFTLWRALLFTSVLMF